VHRRGLRAGLVATAVVLMLAPGVAMGRSEAISGLVPDNASWAYYTTQRYSYGVNMNVDSYPNSSHLYAYLRRCVDNNPIGWYTPNNPAVYTSPDHGYRGLGGFAGSTCFRITARKDYTWPWGSTWWTGGLIF
jgi:hypothetical protein